MEALETAKRQLRILTVNLRNSVLHVREGVDIRTLTRDDLQTQQQGYRSVGSVTENHISLPDGAACWEYLFDYRVGARLISVQESDQSESGGEAAPLLTMEAVFSAHYIAEDKVDEDAIVAFAEEDVGYHVWPYWREYVQSSSSRMGIGLVFQVPHYMVQGRSEPTGHFSPDNPPPSS